MCGIGVTQCRDKSGAMAWRLTAGMTLLKRFTLIIDKGTIEHVFYPVFPPDQSASDLLAWLSQQPRS